MPICKRWKAKPNMQEQCRLACTKETKNCGNCTYWETEDDKCRISVVLVELCEEGK